jgi:hypothetical protein
VSTVTIVGKTLEALRQELLKLKHGRTDNTGTVGIPHGAFDISTAVFKLFVARFHTV